MFSVSERPRRVALYSRVSTEEQAETGDIVPQNEFLRHWAQLYNCEIAGQYVDDGVSGTIPLRDRPDGRRLMDDAEAGLFDAVVFKRVDRFVRRADLLTEAYKALDKLGIAICSATEPFDTSTPVGRFVMQLFGSLAELDKESLMDRLTTGRDYRARDGKWQGGWIPYGHVTDDQGHLVPSPHPAGPSGQTEAAVMADLYQRIGGGSTLYTEAQRLNALGVPAVRRGTSGHVEVKEGGWTRSRVTVLLHNPIYKGVGTLKSKRGTVHFDVPALVDAETWERAQRQLITNRTFSRAEEHQRYLLRGLIQCERCGGRYVGQFVDRKYRSYRCTTEQGPGHDRVTCGAARLRADDLEAAIWTDCRWFILHPEQALDEARVQLRRRMAKSASAAEERRHILRQIAEKDQERERVMTLYRRNRITLDEVERQIDDIAGEATALRQLIDAINAQGELAAMFEAQVTEASVLLGRLQNQVEEIERRDDFDAKRAIIETLVTRIAVETIGEGRERQPAVTVHYTFGQPAVVYGEDSSGSTTHICVRNLIAVTRALAVA